MNNKFNCGIDVSKKKLDVVLLKEEKFHYKVFENSNDGVILLQEWIYRKGRASRLPQRAYSL